MALTSFPEISKLVTLRDETKYAYVHVGASDSKPTFLLLHGFPSASYDWRHQIVQLSSAGYGVLAPDLLGYGDTDKPIEVEAYSFKRMSQHVAEILEREKLEKVIAVGHDWGSILVSRLVNHYPERFSALVFIAVGYLPPGGAMDIDAINSITEKAFGYPTFGYWELFNSADGAEVLDRNKEAATALFYPSEPEVWKSHMGPIGAARSWISTGTVASPPRWLTSEEVATHNRIFEQEGYTGPLNWYKSAVHGIDSADNAEISEERKHIKVPTLLIVAEQDYVAGVEMQISGTASWVNNLRTERIKSGHWVQLEEKEKVGELLVEFAEKNVSGQRP